MAIHYDLYRFGPDEAAVGHLINGTLPDDDDERWQILDAPRYRIETLLADHVRAQDTLRRCRDERRPFVLFLRSFSAESRAFRPGAAFGNMMTAHSRQLQESLRFSLMQRQVPVVRLFGGSDALFGGTSIPGALDAGVLSAHADNWLEVATELVSSASAIIFLVSHFSEGVALEIERIRGRNRQDSSLIVLIDPRKTFTRDESQDIETLHREFHDFPNVFELEPSADSPRLSTTAAAFRTCLDRQLEHAGAPAGLHHSLEAEFSYLEPDYFASDDYADTERFLWSELRRLTAVFDDRYWSALKARDVSYRNLRFEHEWVPAHRAYGLAIAVADFAAIRAALVPLELLYVVRGSLYAFNIRALRQQFADLAVRGMPSGVRDTESRYTDHGDPLKLPASQDAALRMFEHAEEAARNRNLDTANYLYQVAVNTALACEDRDEVESRWILSRMTHDWAKFQAGTNLVKWAEVNYEYSLSITRELARTDPDRCLPDAALCLNNLGALRYRLGDLESCEAAFGEAVEIRRARPADHDYHENLGHSLMNLGMVAMARHDAAKARGHYEESIRLTGERLSREPHAIIDLAHRQILLAHCLQAIPGAEQEAEAAAAAAAASLPAVAAVNADAARDFEAALRHGPGAEYRGAG